MDTDFCKKCGVEVLAKDIVWHYRRCEVEGFVIPEGMSKCRKCKRLLNGGRMQHEGKCRGSEIANRTCSKCGKVFPELEFGMGLSRPMRNHELRCTAVVGGPEPEAAAKAKAKAKAKAAAKGKGKAKAKAKAAPEAKAKAKGKAGAKAKPKAKAQG